MENVRIRMFGRLEMMLGAERLRPFATRKSRSLFAYLLLYRDRCHPRDVLAGMFWGEFPEPVARKHLRDALWRIRQVVAAIDRHGLQLEVEDRAVGVELDRQSWLDIREFERSLGELDGHRAEDISVEQASLLRRAVELYRADLLEEVYEDWCVYDRERLRVLGLDALHRLMRFHLRRQEWSIALLHGQRLLMADPMHEPVHRALMRCYAGLDNRTAAVKQFQQCRKILREELEIDPAPDTVALYEQIRQFDVLEGAPPASSREPRKAALEEALDRMRHADRGLRRTRRDLRAGTEAVRRALSD
ncbi:MAG: BTAD domain-containing putative transcriptional regulator [Gemmatimonadota bacterium]